MTDSPIIPALVPNPIGNPNTSNQGLSHNQSPCPSKPWLRNFTPEEQRAGGRMKTEKKRIANQIKNLRRKKCKHCTLGCPVRDSNMTKDFETTCSIPETQRLILKMGAEPEIIMQKLKLLLLDMDAISSKSGKLRDIKQVYESLIDFKKEFCPTTQTIKHEGQMDLGLNEILKIAQESKKANVQKDTGASSTNTTGTSA